MGSLGAWGQDRPVAQTASPEAGAAETGASAEGSSSEGIPAKVQAAGKRIQYVGPDIYILLDAEGRAQPVPGMTYEDFLEAWKKSQEKGRATGTARYTIEKVAMAGRARENYAELEFAATIHILADGKIEVPLGLVGALLNGEPKFAPIDGQAAESNRAAEDYLTHDAGAGGFVARLAGKAGEQRRVTLNLIVPLVRDGAETTLQLSCPKAVTSELTLDVNGTAAQVAVANGMLLEQQSNGEKKGTRLRVAGPAGPFRMTWQSSDDVGNEFATVLSAAGNIRVSIDGRSVRSDAALTVQSFGRGFARFRVRLPAGAQLIPGRATESDAANTNYRITVEQETANAHAPGAVPGRAIALVQFVEEQQAPVTIQLATEQPIGLQSDALVELAGFEVLGAVRQYGDVGLEVADDWQARWEAGRNVRQVDAAELSTALQQSAPTAAFQYDGQPWSLGVRVAARQSRVHVTPRYEVQLLPAEARLALRLNYQVSGARVFEFRVRLEGWELVSGTLESAGLVDQDRLFVGEQTLVLPLAQASTPRAEISLTLRRPLAAEQKPIELPLPAPVANSVGTGDVILRSANGFELRTDLQNSRGLSTAPTIEVADERDASNGNEWRFKSTAPEPVIVAERVQRTREVSIAGVSQIEIGQNDASVEQRLTYDVLYEPVDELLIQTPLELPVDGDQVTVAMLPAGQKEEVVDEAGIPLEIAEVADVIDSEQGLIANQLRIALPTPQIGRLTVAVRYRVQRPDNSAGTTWDLPLARPNDGTIASWTAVVGAPRSVAVALHAKSIGSLWKAAAPSNERRDARPPYEFSADGAESVLPLSLSPVESSPTAATAIDRVWLQTWLSGNVRQDRAAFRFRTSGLQATVELPPLTAVDDVEVLVDGQRAENLSQAAGRVVVRLEPRQPHPSPLPEGEGETQTGALPEGEGEMEHTLELRSRVAINTALVTRHRLTPPQLLGTSSLSHVYWQIVLPGDQHVVRSPARMTSAGQWQWLGSFWGRRPRLAQDELEKWVGATSQIAPAMEHNQYLYTGISPAQSIEMITAPRWLVVLSASAAVLAMSLAWIYVPAVRRQWVLAAFAIVLAGLAVAFPVPAILLAQASVLGVAAAIAALIAARLARRPALVPISVSTGSSRYSPRAESVSMPPVVATASTAPTVPLRVPESER